MFEFGGTGVCCVLTQLMNGIKNHKIFAQSLNPYNITSLLKNKRSRKDYNMNKEVLRVLAFRSILERLLFNDEYETLENKITDSIVGGRKVRNLLDSIFVSDAAKNSVKKEKKNQ